MERCFLLTQNANSLKINTSGSSRGGLSWDSEEEPLPELRVFLSLGVHQCCPRWPNLQSLSSPSISWLSHCLYQRASVMARWSRTSPYHTVFCKVPPATTKKKKSPCSFCPRRYQSQVSGPRPWVSAEDLSQPPQPGTTISLL